MKQHVGDKVLQILTGHMLGFNERRRYIYLESKLLFDASFSADMNDFTNITC